MKKPTDFVPSPPSVWIALSVLYDSYFLLSLFVFEMQGIEPKAFCMLGEYSVIKL